MSKASKMYFSVEVNVVWKAVELMTSFMRAELMIGCLWFSNVPLTDLLLVMFCETQNVKV